MTEIPKRSLETHPLWPLFKFVSVELWANFHRLVSSDFSDINEANFRDFLEKEAMDKLSHEIAGDFEPEYARLDLSRRVITDPKTRKTYETGWKKLFLKARSGPLNEVEITREVDHLFDIWNKSQKMRITFSSN